MLADTDALQERLYKEMRGRIQEADEGVPVRHGPFQYYRRTLEGKQYSVHCRRRLGPDASPEPSGKKARRAVWRRVACASDPRQCLACVPTLFLTSTWIAMMGAIFSTPHMRRGGHAQPEPAGGDPAGRE